MSKSLFWCHSKRHAAVYRSTVAVHLLQHICYLTRSRNPELELSCKCMYFVYLYCTLPTNDQQLSLVYFNVHQYLRPTTPSRLINNLQLQVISLVFKPHGTKISIPLCWKSRYTNPDHLVAISLPTTALLNQLSFLRTNGNRKLRSRSCPRTSIGHKRILLIASFLPHSPAPYSPASPRTTVPPLWSFQSNHYLSSLSKHLSVIIGYVRSCIFLANFCVFCFISYLSLQNA